MPARWRIQSRAQLGELPLMSNRHKPLTLDSPPQEIISHLRRAAILNQIGCTPYSAPHRKCCPDRLAERLAAAHVFYFAGLLDTNSDDHLAWPQIKQLLNEADELRAGVGLFLPFPRTVFIEANGAADMLSVFYLEQTETELCAQSFNYFPTDEHWMWIGTLALKRQDAIIQSPKDNGIRAMIWPRGFPPNNAAGRNPVTEHTALCIWAGLALLNRKGDTVILAPAESIAADGPAKPKAFEIANPRVAVVRVGAPRILQTAPSEPTGATVRPHDRREHLRRVGNRWIKVRQAKIHGGAATPTPKIVRPA
jgi:hypothetical protein